jgi:hypothetical protein
MRHNGGVPFFIEIGFEGFFSALLHLEVAPFIMLVPVTIPGRLEVSFGLFPPLQGDVSHNFIVSESAILKHS